MYTPTKLIGFECGYGFFAGDIVHHAKKGDGRVVCIYKDTKALQVSFHDDVGDFFTIANAKVKLEHTGNRVEAPMFPKDVLKYIYSQYKTNRKVYFLYHYYKPANTNKKTIGCIENKLHIGEDKIREILKVYKEKNLL